jgi:hypothetical protein
MHTAISCTFLAGALAIAAPAAAQGNGAPLNNGAEAYFTFSDPSIGASTGTNPPDFNGDLWWRAHPGQGFMNDVDAALGSVMEIDGYVELLLDEDWSTSPSFLDRVHGPAVEIAGGLQPSFFSVPGNEVFVTLGPSGFSSPCTLYPSLCSPSGSTCAPPGSAHGWITDIVFPSTPGSGVVLPADGTAASDMATAWFLQGGWSTTGGACGGGTNETSAVSSVDETQADVTGTGINPSGGFQIAGGGPIQNAVVSMAEAHVTWRGSLVNVVADSGTGLGVEGGVGGGAMNGRNLSVGSGLATIGVELRDNGAASPSVGIVGASTIPLANPGIPMFGGWLGVLPDGVFTATSSVWQGTSTGGAMLGAQLPVPATVGGATLYLQGATFSLTGFTADTTNVVRTNLVP